MFRAQQLLLFADQPYHLQQSSNMQPSQAQYLSIITNKVPIRLSNIYHMLVFQWVLFAYYVYMFLSVTNSSGSYQMRIIIYCIIFLLFDKLYLTSKYLQLEDPLHLSPITNCVVLLIYLCLLNLVAFLIRIAFENQNLHAFMIFMHFVLIIALFLNQFSKKSTKLDINVDSNIFSKYVTPISLFIFNKTVVVEFSQFMCLQLLFFVINQFLSSELNRILLLKECQYLGWMSVQESRKEKLIWNRRRSLRSIIVICCVIIVVQNLLLIFDRIKFEVSVLIIQSLIVSGLAYLLYVGYLPYRK